MSKVRVDLCANDKPISLLQIENIDVSAYTRLVVLDDTIAFVNAVMFFMGAAHGIGSHPQFADIVFTIEFDGDHTWQQTAMLSQQIEGAVTESRLILGECLTADIENRVITVLPKKKH